LWTTKILTVILNCNPRCLFCGSFKTSMVPFASGPAHLIHSGCILRIEYYCVNCAAIITQRKLRSNEYDCTEQPFCHIWLQRSWIFLRPWGWDGKNDLRPSEGRETLKQIFEYLGQSGKRCCIAIDEFQQILNFPESGVEALIRSYI